MLPTRVTNACYIGTMSNDIYHFNDICHLSCLACRIFEDSQSILSYLVVGGGAAPISYRSLPRSFRYNFHCATSYILDNSPGVTYAVCTLVNYQDCLRACTVLILVARSLPIRVQVTMLDHFFLVILETLWDHLVKELAL